MSEKPIMLIEDDEDDVALTLRAMERANVQNEFIVARDGVEAIERLFDTSLPTPQLILLDLQMPRMGGLEVLKRIRANDRTHLLPVVILTSSEEERDLVEGYASGANSYIRKPVDLTSFIEAVTQLKMYWLVLNTPAPERA